MEIKQAIYISPSRNPKWQTLIILSLKKKREKKNEWILDEIRKDPIWHQRWDLRLLSPIVRKCTNFRGSVGISNHIQPQIIIIYLNNILGLINFDILSTLQHHIEFLENIEQPQNYRILTINENISFIIIWNQINLIT